MNAVREAVGTTTLAQDGVWNDALSESLVAVYSQGYIESVRTVGEPRQERGLWIVNVLCVIREGQLLDDLEVPDGRRRSMEIQSSFAVARNEEHQRRNSGVIAREVFRDFPMRVLELECGEFGPVGGTPDSDTRTFELDVRVSISLQRWSQWLDHASRSLNAIAEEHGEVAWSLFQKGWLPMHPDEPLDSESGVFMLRSRLKEFRDIPMLRQFVPEADRRGGVLYIRDVPGEWPSNPLAMPEHMPVGRVLAIHDPSRRVVKWWRLSSAAWGETCDALRRVPSVKVHLDDGTGQVAGEVERDWLKDAGGFRERYQRIGRPELHAQIGPEEDVRFRVLWSMRASPAGGDGPHVLVPAARIDLTCGKGSGYGFVPVTVFPYRIVVPRSVADNPNPITLRCEWVQP